MDSSADTETNMIAMSGTKESTVPTPASTPFTTKDSSHEGALTALRADVTQPAMGPLTVRVTASMSGAATTVVS